MGCWSLTYLTFCYISNEHLHIHKPHKKSWKKFGKKKITWNFNSNTANLNYNTDFFYGKYLCIAVKDNKSEQFLLTVRFAIANIRFFSAKSK